MLNSANVVLTGGHKCFASKYSLLGDFGYIYKGWGLKNLAKDWNVKQ